MEPSDAYEKADEILSNEEIKQNLTKGFYLSEFNNDERDRDSYIRGFLARIVLDISEFQDIATDNRLAMRERREKLEEIAAAAIDLSEKLARCKYENMWNIGIRDINYRPNRDYAKARPGPIMSLAYQVDLAENRLDALEKYREYAGAIRLTDYLEGLSQYAGMLSKQVHPYAPPDQSKTTYSLFVARAIYKSLRHEIPEPLHKDAKINKTTKLIGDYFDIHISDDTLKKIKRQG